MMYSTLSGRVGVIVVPELAPRNGAPCSDGASGSGYANSSWDLDQKLCCQGMKDELRDLSELFSRFEKQQDDFTTVMHWIHERRKRNKETFCKCPHAAAHSRWVECTLCDT